MSPDPFARYLDMWSPTLGFEGAFDSWLEKQRLEGRDAAYVLPDMQPFRSNDGAFINGRRQWREHLRANELVELGHSDIKAGQEAWSKRKAIHRERVERASKLARTEHVESEFSVKQRSRVGVEVANRLHGRPTPTRRELIRLTLDVARKVR